jgi:hypothetical protein
MNGIRGRDNEWTVFDPMGVCTLFVLSSQYVLFEGGYCPYLTLSVLS